MVEASLSEIWIESYRPAKATYAQRIGIFGLAFKDNADDVRESPVVLMMEQLLGKGRQLRVWDPHVQLDQIYGSNQNFLLATIPHIAGLVSGSLEELLTWTQHLVVLQKDC